MAKPKLPEKREANLSLQQMEVALPRIERRLTALSEFDPETVDDRHDPRIKALESELDTLLVNTFGVDTVEYKRYRVITVLDTAGMSYMHATPIPEVRQGLVRGVKRARAQLLSIKEWFEEELADAGVAGPARALKAYEGLDLHPAIERASGQLYRDGHYANAIEDAVKALNSSVWLNSGIDDRDGVTLMEFVFNPKNPVLRFNALADQSDRDEQKGFMMLFSGAVAGLRNPRAHKLIQDDPERALEFIAFISLLAKLADKAHK